MSRDQYFSLVDVQARMALRAEASRHYLGYLWWLLEPLLWVAVFYVVFNVILDSKRVDFLVFLMCGKLPFIWFSKTVVQASNSLVANRGLIAKIDVPKTLFPMAVIQESLYRQSAVFCLLFAVVIANGYSLSINWLWLVVIMFVQYLVIVLCSFIGAALVCVIRDFSMLIPLCMTFLLFTSGIFWDVRNLGDPAKTELILLMNPIAFILDAYRQILMYQATPDLMHLLGIGLFAVALISFVVLMMKKSSQFLALKAMTA